MSHTKANLRAVEDSAPKFDMPAEMQARFARTAIEGETLGLSLFKLEPGFRIPFGHKHATQEEVYVVVKGSALVKVHAFASLLDEVHVSAVALLRQRRALVNVSKTYASLAASRAASPVLDDLAERRVSHPTDTHPTLTDRLTALGESLHSVSGFALDVSPQPSAAVLLNDPEALELEVSDAYKRWLLDHPETLARVSDSALPVVIHNTDVEVISDVLCRFCRRPLPTCWAPCRR